MNRGPIRTLHVNSEPHWRGGERQTLLLVRGLLERGHRADLVAARASPLAARARECGVGVTEMPLRGDLDPRAVARLAALLARGGYQVLHMHTPHAHTLGCLASALSRRVRRVVSRRVEFSIVRHRLSVSRFKYRHLVHRYVAVSHAVKRALVRDGVAGERISVVWSGVEPPGPTGDPGPIRKAWGVPRDALVLGTVARLARHKGHEHLVDAMPAILEHCPRARLVLVGEGDKRPLLKSRAAGLGLGDRVLLPGFTRDVHRAIAAMDLFVMPSLQEGLCTSILDAAWLGKPVVASRAGGIPEIVETLGCGLLVPPADPGALARAVARVLGDAALRHGLVAAGTGGLERHFSVRSMVEGNLAVYRDLLEGAAEAPARPGGAAGDSGWRSPENPG